MSWPCQSARRLAEAVFARDARKSLSISFSGFFYGALKIQLSASTGDAYTTQPKPGVAIINVSIPLAVKAAGYSLDKPVPKKEADRAAALIKRAFLAMGYHEVGHLKMTDMSGDGVKELRAKGVSESLISFAREVANIIEDPTMERMFSHEGYYAFTGKYFRWLVNRIFVEQGQNYSDSGDIMSFLQYMLLFVRLGAKRIKGRNAQFDSLAAKGLIPMIFDAAREPDGRKRFRKQLDIGLWIAKELNLDDQQLNSAKGATPQRPVIILIDPTSKNGQKQIKQAPMQGPLPPVSIAEASDDGDGGQGQMPDADIIDLRKNKPQGQDQGQQSQGQGQNQDQQGQNQQPGQQSQGQGQDQQSGQQGQGQSQQGQGQNQGQDQQGQGQNQQPGQQSQSQQSQDQDQDQDQDQGQSQQGQDQNQQTQGQQGQGQQSGQQGQDEGQSQGQQGQGQDQQGSYGSGKSVHVLGGPMDATAQDFAGGEDPLEIHTDDFNDSFLSIDPDLAAAAEMEDGAKIAYFEDEYEVLDGDTLAEYHRQMAENFSSEILDLTESIAEMRAETAPQVHGRLEDGEDIDIDAAIENEQSPYPATDVFQEERKGRPMTDLAVSFLVDCSGSMKGTRSVCAYSTAAMIIAACADNDVPTEVAAFSDSDVLYAKRFEDSPEKAPELLGILNDRLDGNYRDIGNMLWGGTNLAHALPTVLGRLKAFHGTAFKALFIITDGDTGDRDRVKALVEDAKSNGIICVAVGIGVSEERLRECFGECRSFDANSLRTLPTYVSDVLKEALEDRELWLDD